MVTDCFWMERAWPPGLLPFPRPGSWLTPLNVPVLDVPAPAFPPLDAPAAAFPPLDAPAAAFPPLDAPAATCLAEPFLARDSSINAPYTIGTPHRDAACQGTPSCGLFSNNVTETHEAQTSRPCVLGIDLGTGGPRAVLVATDGMILSSASAPVNTTFLPNGGAEQDPEEWWR
ncbi:protein containing Carbohydrate kinase, FGGY, partial [mine drainage metagenome]